MPRSRADDAFPELAQPGIAARSGGGAARGQPADHSRIRHRARRGGCGDIGHLDDKTCGAGHRGNARSCGGGGTAGGSSSTPPEVAVAAAPQTIAVPTQVVVAPEALPAVAPAATPVLPGASSLPGPVATAPDILAVMPVVTGPATLAAPVQPLAPPQTDAFDAVIEIAAIRPDALVEVRSAPTPLADSLADLPPAERGSCGGSPVGSGRAVRRRRCARRGRVAAAAGAGPGNQSAPPAQRRRACTCHLPPWRS